MKTILFLTIFFFLFALCAAFLLSFLEQKTATYQSKRKGKVYTLLPGTNCGGCGCQGCSEFAEAIVRGEMRPVRCTSITRESIEKIEKICGLTIPEEERLIAHVMCSGGSGAKDKFIYEGIRDCRIAATLSGGTKFCPDGCTGLGNCERACPFDAIRVTDGVAVVDASRCQSCTVCVSACPKGLIQMVPYSSSFGVHCTAKSKGAQVLRSCTAGCIGCKKCEKVCEKGAITVENNCAFISQAKCNGCGECVKVCPRGIIRPFFDK